MEKIFPKESAKGANTVVREVIRRKKNIESVSMVIPFHSSLEVLPMLLAVSTIVLWYYEVIPPQTWSFSVEVAFM